MPYTLEIRSTVTPAINLDLLGGSLYLKKYEPKLTVEIAPNTYGDLVEEITLIWSDTTGDQQAATMRTLWDLKRLVNEHWTYKHLYDFVYLAAQTPTETNPRYSLLKSIDFDVLPESIYGPGQTSELTIRITREGFWRGLEPGATPSLFVSSQLENDVTPAKNRYNYIDLTGTVNGDLPALTRYVMADSHTYMLGVMSRPTVADFTDVVLSLCGSTWSQSSGTWVLVADTNYPNEERLALQVANSSGVLYKDLTIGTIQNWAGTYNVYYWVQVDATTATVQFSNNGRQFSEVVDIGGNVLHSWDYLGRFDFPAGGYNPNAPVAQYRISLTFAKSTDGGLNHGMLQLVPVGEQPMFYVNAESVSNDLWIDGIYGKTYNSYTAGTVRALGPIPGLIPGRVNRVVNRRMLGGSDGRQVPYTAHNVDIYLCERFSGLRGSY